MTYRAWQVNRPDEQAAAKLAAQIGAPTLLARVLTARGLDTPEMALGLLGQDAGFVAAELQRRLEDALLADDRITGIENFEYSVHGQSLAASFTVKTIYGSVDSATEVNVTA